MKLHTDYTAYDLYENTVEHSIEEGLISDSTIANDVNEFIVERDTYNQLFANSNVGMMDGYDDILFDDDDFDFIHAVDFPG